MAGAVSSLLFGLNRSMDSNLVTLQTFSTGMEAELAKGALDAAGITAMIQADSAGGMEPSLAWAGRGFKLLVREEDAGPARDVLESPGTLN